MPAAIIIGLTPGTAAKLPAEIPAMNAGMELAGRPADASAGGTTAGMVLSSRLERMTV